MQKKNMTGLGVASQLATFMAGGSVSTGQTATGSSSLANSFTLVDDITIFTTAPGNSGAKPRSDSAGGDVFIVSNYDSNTMLLYPPTSAGKLNKGSAGASINLTTLKTAMMISIDGVDFAVITSA